MWVCSCPPPAEASPPPSPPRRTNPWLPPTRPPRPSAPSRAWPACRQLPSRRSPTRSSSRYDLPHMSPGSHFLTPVTMFAPGNAPHPCFRSRPSSRPLSRRLSPSLRRWHCGRRCGSDCGNGRDQDWPSLILPPFLNPGEEGPGPDRQGSHPGDRPLHHRPSRSPPDPSPHCRRGGTRP